MGSAGGGVQGWRPSLTAPSSFAVPSFCPRSPSSGRRVALGEAETRRTCADTKALPLHRDAAWPALLSGNCSPRFPLAPCSDECPCQRYHPSWQLQTGITRQDSETGVGGLAPLPCPWPPDGAISRLPDGGIERDERRHRKERHVVVTALAASCAHRDTICLRVPPRGWVKPLAFRRRLQEVCGTMWAWDRTGKGRTASISCTTTSCSSRSTANRCCEVRWPVECGS